MQWNFNAKVSKYNTIDIIASPFALGERNITDIFNFIKKNALRSVPLGFNYLLGWNQDRNRNVVRNLIILMKPQLMLEQMYHSLLIATWTKRSTKSRSWETENRKSDIRNLVGTYH